MDKYLLEILKEVNTIIIPGIGALTVTNNQTGEVMFMSFLKHDDGNLAKFIAAKEGIEVNEAKNMIAKYVREIESLLNRGESYDIFRFGSFHKATDGEIIFNQWSSDASAEVEKKEEYPKGDVAAVETDMTSSNVEENSDHFTEPETEKVSEEIKEDIEINAEEKVALELNTPPIEEKDVEEVVVPTDKIIIDPIVIEPDEQKAKPDHSESSTPAPYRTEPIIQHESDSEKEKIKRATEQQNISRNKSGNEGKQTESTPKKKPKGVLFYVMIAAIVLLVGGGITIGFFYNSLESFFGSQQTKESKANVQTQESATSQENEEPPVTEESQVEETTDTDETTSETTPTSSSPSTSSSGNYFIIVGSFTVKSNAERFSANITESTVKECQGKFYVVIGSFSSSQEAQSQIGNVPQNLNPWIFRIPC
jgi:nucleoid DNA-binding protein